MDSTLDFVTRARLAWQQFRHPAGIDHLRNAEEGPVGEAEAPRRSPAWPLDRHEPSPLNEFRLLVGIYQHETFSAPHGFMANRRPQASLENRPAPNMGIYTTVCDSEIKCKRNYKLFSRLINGCLGLQIVVAAALTALGAADGSRSAVTVFGAINTIIAGFLTYLKGSGLPNRLKYFQHEWTKVREYIEQRERDFMLDSNGLNAYEEVDKIRQMYEVVKADIESNRPDRFVSVSALSKQPITQAPGPSLTRPQPSFSTESFRKGWADKEKEAGVAVNKAQGTANNLFSNMANLKDVLEDKVKEIGHMEKEIEDKGHKMVEEKKHGIMDQIQSAVKEVAHLGKEMEAKAKAAATETVAEKEHEAQAAMNRAAEAARTTTAQQRDNLSSALSERQREAEDAYNRGFEAARAGMAQQRDNLNTAVNEGAHGVDDAVARTSDVARTALQQQRDHLNAALSEKDESVPPKPGSSQP